MKKFLLTFLFGILFIFGGCVNSQPKLSQMQLREITSKEISGDYKTVFKATLSILQDQNYIIKNSDLDTGLISCEKFTETEDISMILLYGSNSEIHISAIINSINKNTTKIRLNIQESIIIDGGFGQKKTFFITNREIYDSLFNQIKVEVERLKALK